MTAHFFGCLANLADDGVDIFFLKGGTLIVTDEVVTREVFVIGNYIGQLLANK